MIEAAAREGATHSQPAADSSWPALGRTLFADIVAIVRERLHLVALEGQQFVHAAGRLLAFGLAAALLVLTAWFVVIAALVALLVHVGLPLAAALLIGAVLNLMAAALAWVAMRRQLVLMSFSATLRSLQLSRTGTSVSAAPSTTNTEQPGVEPAAGPLYPDGRRSTGGGVPRNFVP